jgi:hypothetical protein
MKAPHLLAIFCSLCLVTVAQPAQAALEVTLDSGMGTQVFTDMDADGDVEFDTTVSGIFEARGIAKEELTDLRGRVTLAPLDPNPTALFRNVSASAQTFTVTVKSTAFGAPIASPTGWKIHYYAAADDLVDMTVDIPAHSVAAKINNGAVTLGTATGAPLLSATDVEAEASAVDANAASDVSLVWTITLGANDEFRLGSDNDFDGDSIQVDVFNQTQKCIDKMNNSARKVADAAQKSDNKCLKEIGMDVTACVDNLADEKTEKKEAKLDADFATICDPVPAYGVNGSSCCEGGTGEGSTCVADVDCGGGICTPGACIGAAADAGAGDLSHDLFGPTVAVSADKPTAKCQQGISKSLGKIYTTRWKSFRGCKKDNFAIIAGDAMLKVVCLDPQPDLDGKILKSIGKLADAAQKKCVDKGVTGLGALFPGECTGAPDNGIATCLSQRANCRFCIAVNEADDIDPPLDCDTFDDALANASCP